jgi:hypothetical protein
MATMRAWIIRAGSDGRSVDRFVDEGIIALDYDAIDDLTRLDRWSIERRLEDVDLRPADVHADLLISFLHEVVRGDVVVMADTARSEVVIGVVDGGYEHAAWLPEGQHRHRRRVDWLARHPRADLPSILADVSRQRVAMRRVDSPQIDDHLAAVRAGTIGRPADQRTAPRPARASSTGSVSRTRTTARAPRRAPTPRPGPATVATRRCDGCFQTKPVTQFDGDGPWCRDCT